MCSIFAILDIQSEPDALKARALGLSRRLRHRGPDAGGVFASSKAVIVHERLAIVDIEGGAQPLRSSDERVVVAANAEIYNHRELRAEFAAYPFRTDSDCEVLLPLFQRHGQQFVQRLNGIFAFVVFDQATNRFLIARDPIGVVPLYTGRDRHGNLYVASEQKALVDDCVTIDEFPPGHVWTTGTAAPVRYYHPTWRDYQRVHGNPLDLPALRESFEAAVSRQLMSDAPYGVLLSGGLDSSLTSAVAKRLRPDAPLHSFAIGLLDSQDLPKARLAAKAIGSVHHELSFSLDEGFNALSEVIYHIETYDLTTVRASVPMYLMSRRIKASGIKMVLTGEGADEIFGGYLYFHKAPNAREFHAETVRKLEALHKYDCLRANKTLAAWGIEARVPFLDLEFLETSMSIDPAHKMCNQGRIEKSVLRQAFAGVLPDNILWRQKEQFSDGVGYSWIDGLKALAERVVTDQQLCDAAERFPINPPTSKEGYLYRQLYAEHFPSHQSAALVPGGPTIACSSASAIAWDKAFAGHADPSGRAVRGVHQYALRSEPTLRSVERQPAHFDTPEADA